MPDEKPTFENYRAWHQATFNEKIDKQTEVYFGINAVAAYSTALTHPFIEGLERTLETIAERYRAKTGSRLFTEEPRLDLKKKSFESALNKAFRINVVKNRHFPNPPKDGWIQLKDWFAAMNDLIRCSFVCRYIDGPRFVAEELRKATKAAGHESRFDSVQLDRGYYAYHFYVEIPAVIPYWTQAEAKVSLEIQLTTQLQEIVLDLTHRFYEDLRLKEDAAQREDGWKWEYKSARFKAGYLSHTLHLLEGLVAEVREQAGHAGEEPEPAPPPQLAEGAEGVAPATGPPSEAVAGTGEVVAVAAQQEPKEHHEHAGSGAAASQAAHAAGAAPPDDPEASAGG